MRHNLWLKQAITILNRYEITLKKMGRGEKGVWHSGQDAALGMGIVAQQVKSMLGILDSWSRPLLQTAALFQFKYSPLSLTVRGKQMMT